MTGLKFLTLSCISVVVMQHRMMSEAQKAMAPWLHGQPVYAPIGSNGSSQANPLLYSGVQHNLSSICHALMTY